MQDSLAIKHINTTIKLLSTHSGRDKVAKTLHYGARILYWYYMKKNMKQRANEIETFRQAIGNSRRVGRFFSSINAVPTVYQLIKRLLSTSQAKDGRLLKILLLVANVSDMFYYIADNLTYAAKYGFIHMSKDSMYFWEELVGSWSWLISVLIYIYNDLLTYNRLLDQRKLLQQAYSAEISFATPTSWSALNSSPPSFGSTKSELATTNEEIYNSRLNLIKNLADLQLAIFFCFPNSSWPSQWVGLFGMINAITGGYQIYRNYYKTA
jgi:hypothetical protein